MYACVNCGQPINSTPGMFCNRCQEHSSMDYVKHLTAQGGKYLGTEIDWDAREITIRILMPNTINTISTDITLELNTGDDT